MINRKKLWYAYNETDEERIQAQLEIHGFIHILTTTVLDVLDTENEAARVAAVSLENLLYTMIAEYEALYPEFGHLAIAWKGRVVKLGGLL